MSQGVIRIFLAGTGGVLTTTIPAPDLSAFGTFMREHGDDSRLPITGWLVWKPSSPLLLGGMDEVQFWLQPGAPPEDAVEVEATEVMEAPVALHVGQDGPL